MSLNRSSAIHTTLADRRDGHAGDWANFYVQVVEAIFVGLSVVGSNRENDSLVLEVYIHSLLFTGKKIRIHKSTFIGDYFVCDLTFLIFHVEQSNSISAALRN